jgi:hypothetical protein
LLAPAGIACPPFETYVEKIVAYVTERVRERRNVRAAAPGAGEEASG